MPSDYTYKIDVPNVRTEDTLLPGNAGLAEVHVVPFTVLTGPARGHSASVRVPFADYTPAEVDRLIRARIETLHGLDQLGAEPVYTEG